MPEAAVEIVMQDEGLVGSRYPAIVVSVDHAQKQARVEHEQLFEDDAADGSPGAPLCENTPFAQITPRPPPPPVDFAKSLRIGLPLQLLYNGGWWDVTLLEIKGGSDSQAVYHVAYNSYRHRVALNLLRPQWRFSRGQWQVDETPKALLKRPPGRAPKGKWWDPRVGWEDASEEEEAKEEEAEEEEAEEAEEEARAQAPQPLTADEARAAAADEGLELVPSPTRDTGFKYVYKEGGKYAAKIRENGGLHHLGSFTTPEEAALHYSRHIGAERASAAAEAARAARAAKKRGAVPWDDDDPPKEAELPDDEDAPTLGASVTIASDSSADSAGGPSSAPPAPSQHTMSSQQRSIHKKARPGKYTLVRLSRG